RRARHRLLPEGCRARHGKGGGLGRSGEVRGGRRVAAVRPASLDTDVDCGLLRGFGAQDRITYAERLPAVCHPGGRVHILALSDIAPGFGPRISDAVVHAAFTEATGWRLLEMRTSSVRAIVPPDAGPELGLAPNQPADMLAWLATAQRLG